MKYGRTKKAMVLIGILSIVALMACDPTGLTDIDDPTGIGDTDDPTGEPDAGDPQVSITSHVTGETIFGSRTITLEGTLSDSIEIASVQVSLNGTAAAATFTQTAFSAELELVNRTNAIVVTATNTSDTVAKAEMTVHYPFVTLSSFQSASVVIGQADFASGSENRGGAPGSNTISTPEGNPIVHDGRLYLPEYGGQRVLGFNTVPSANDVSADFVLGQADFTSSAQTAEATGMTGPQTVAVGNGKMAVAEFDNNRVLIWNTVPTSTQVAADVVVGQPAFVQSASASTQSGLSGPESVHIADGKLIVSDSNNSRILIWNSIPTENGAAADLVLGQTNFTNNTGNDDDQNGAEDGAPSARTLIYPGGVWSDGTRLMVADTGNNRILIWNTFPSANFAAADVVIGQSSMTLAVSDVSAQALSSPNHIFSNGNQLFAADYDNCRVLIWNSIPTENHAAADIVLGQTNFANNAGNDDDQNGLGDGVPSARTLNYPGGVLAFDDRLIVADTDNHRYLIFQGL